jgi:hypothetical protein
MYRDKALTFWQNNAFDAESDVINLTIADATAGEPVYIFFQGGLDFEATSGFTLILEEAELEAGPFAPRMSLELTEREAQGLVKFAVPHPARQWAKLTLTGVTGGSNLNAGVVLDSQLSF